MDARTDLSIKEAASAKRARKNKKRVRDARLSRWGKERASLLSFFRARHPTTHWPWERQIAYYASTFKVTA